MTGSYIGFGKMVIFAFCFGDRVLPRQAGILSAAFVGQSGSFLAFFITHRFAQIKECSVRDFVNN